MRRKDLRASLEVILKKNKLQTKKKKRKKKKGAFFLCKGKTLKSNKDK